MAEAKTKLTKKQIFHLVKPHIIAALEKANKNIFTFSDLNQIFQKNKDNWFLPSKTLTRNFINFLEKQNILSPVNIKLPHQNIKRYIYKNTTIYNMALTINKNSYFSHYSAVYFHNLTDSVPKNIYINNEQYIKKIYDVTLKQENIDMAFSRPMRRTNQIAIIDDRKIFLLNGKNVNKIGVENKETEFGILPVTSIERTLIDITVRPNYAGGVQEILNAYIQARGRVSINRMIAILKKFNYIYPYHQAIGFYLERAGYKESLLNKVEKIEKKYNFYLTYEIKEKSFSSRWNLYFPKAI